MTGAWPRDQIDHINCDEIDNRFANLREATGSQNTANQSKRNDNISGIKGVDWFARNRKWRARICARGTNIHLGLFESIDDAAAAYAKAAREYHGEFARTE